MLAGNGKGIVINMKIQLELEPALESCEVIIRCSEINEEVKQLSQMISELSRRNRQLVYYQNEKEYYFPVQNILFFETSGNAVTAHTAKDMFTVRHKLYELEELLPAYFLRVSKSTILNTREIYSITKNLTAASAVEFQNTHKKVYVSRSYYKALSEVISHR